MPHDEPVWTPEKDAELRALREEAGMTYAEAAGELGLRWGRIFTKAAVKARYAKICGRRKRTVTKPKVDVSAQVAAANKLHEAGLGWREIGRQLGCDKNTIRSRCDPAFREHINKLQSARKAAILAGSHIPKTIRLVHENDEPKNPLYDPHRDGPRPYADSTAAILGDPFVGRSEIMRRVG